MKTETLSGSFSTSLEEAINYASRFKKTCGFLVVVLDHLNNQQNYITQLTSDLYPLIKHQIRTTDTITRFAQDTWLVCLDDCNKELLHQIQFILSTTLSRRLQQKLGFDGTLTNVHGTLFHDQTLNQAIKVVEGEIEKAKSALRRLKMARSSVLGPHQGLTDSEINHSHLINKALLDNRLFIAFQPVVNTNTGNLFYYECLARIIDEGNQLIPAASFIPQCEKSGLIQLLDQKIQQLAVEELMTNRDLRLAINVSAITASDSMWLNTLKSQMTARSDLRGRLMVELTETSVFQNIDESIQFLSQLRDLGCPVSIDDFGAGYMSLSHLKEDLVQTVKIDAQFVKNLKTDPNNLHIIRAIMALTNPYGIKCVAEGVEDEETSRLLRDEKVDALQGYHIGKPSTVRPWIH